MVWANPADIFSASSHEDDLQALGLTSRSCSICEAPSLPIHTGSPGPSKETGKHGPAHQEPVRRCASDVQRHHDAQQHQALQDREQQQVATPPRGRPFGLQFRQVMHLITKPIETPLGPGTLQSELLLVRPTMTGELFLGPPT